MNANWFYSLFFMATYLSFIFCFFKSEFSNQYKYNFSALTLIGVQVLVDDN